MGNNRLWLNSNNTEWLLVLEPPDSGSFPPLVLDAITLPQIDLVHSWGVVLLDSQLLFNEHVAAVAGGILHSFVLCISCVFSLRAHNHSCLSHLPIGLF